MCSKHTKTSNKLTAKQYPQKRKLFSTDTMKQLNKILYCQNTTSKSRKCNIFIPIGSPERQKHHIIPLSKGGTNNYKNILICCIDCHYELHREDFEAKGISLEQFRTDIYYKQKNRLGNNFLILHQCRKARVGVSY
ncbi:MAG TPA: HNH endonuclease signature motif containing protein [Candidatus Deferrimicrobium sp.]|nr:HNH endonuclease signature motif containing protein [Candidatus Deferrimicrobium sp.]